LAIRQSQSGIRFTATARFAFCKLYVSTKERPHIHDTSDTSATVPGKGQARARQSDTRARH